MSTPHKQRRRLTQDLGKRAVSAQKLAVPVWKLYTGTSGFLMWKRVIFSKVKEVKGKRGGVLKYAAQAAPKAQGLPQQPVGLRRPKGD